MSRITDNIVFSFSADPSTTEDILALQKINLRQNIPAENIATEGFVYVEHNPKTLQQICDAEPAVIARDQDYLIAYALCMTKAFGQKVPELVSYFDLLDTLEYESQALKNINYITCGQICVAKEYRGLHILRGLYHQMSLLKTKYKYCITEVSTNNPRSLAAHTKAGFKIIHKHEDHLGEIWAIVLWDWNKV